MSKIKIIGDIIRGKDIKDVLKFIEKVEKDEIKKGGDYEVFLSKNGDILGFLREEKCVKR